MKIAKIIFAGTAALAIIGSPALAQDALTGTVTKVDRISSVIAVQPTQTGTVGANTGGTALEFKTQDGALLDTLHAGDKVTFSTTEAGGVRLRTRRRQAPGSRQPRGFAAPRSRWRRLAVPPG